MTAKKGNKKMTIVLVFLVVILIPAIWFLFLRNDDGFKNASETLTGKWSREDGPYTLEIKALNKDGTIDVAYYNPNPISGVSGKWRIDNDNLFVFVILNDPNYKGSTYELNYSERTKKMGGIYYQAIAKQSFDVYFVKKD